MLVGATPRCRRPCLLPLLLSQAETLRRLHIELACLWRRATTLRQPRYHHLDPRLLARDHQPVIDPHAACRLDSLPVEMHQAAGHRLGGLRTALEAPGKPQPLVDAQVLHGSGPARRYVLT